MSKKELITLQIDIHSNIELNEFCLKLLKELVELLNIDCQYEKICFDRTYWENNYLKVEDLKKIKNLKINFDLINFDDVIEKYNGLWWEAWNKGVFLFHISIGDMVPYDSTSKINIKNIVFNENDSFLNDILIKEICNTIKKYFTVNKITKKIQYVDNSVFINKIIKMIITTK